MSIGLVRFKCGCVGFPPEENGYAVIVSACDVSGDTSPRCLVPREIERGNVYSPLTPVEEKALIKELDLLLYDGWKFRELKSLLK